MAMATLMLLGGSNCQLNAARAVRAMGHRLVLADYLEHPPAASLCDAHLKVSTFDVEACIRAARDARVDGVMTVGSDQPVYTAARVAQALGLPSHMGQQIGDTLSAPLRKQNLERAVVLQPQGHRRQFKHLLKFSGRRMHRH